MATKIHTSNLTRDVITLMSTSATEAIDSSYIQARQTAQDFSYSSLTGKPDFFDSNDATILIDSAYVQSRQAPGTDSAQVSAIAGSLVDSAYVNNRVTITSLDSVNIGTTLINNSGIITLGGNLNVGTNSITVDSTGSIALNDSADITMGSSTAFLFSRAGIPTTTSWDDAPRNAVFYRSGGLGTNSPHGNNAVVLTLSTFAQALGNDAHADIANERAAQLYFGDTQQSGFYYRVKQGTAGWKEWVGLSKGIQAIYYNTTQAHTTTTSNSGFTDLERTFDIRGDESSRILIICTLNGAANDDAHARIEYYDGTSWAENNDLQGSGNTGNSYGNGSFGDFSVVRSSVVEDKQTVQYTATLIHHPNKGYNSTIGYRVRIGAENSNGFIFNRPKGWDNGYNSNTSRSSMIIMEITGWD